MKKITCVMMLTISIVSTAIAQDDPKSNSDKTFNLPQHFAKRRFTMDLGKGNKMLVEINQAEDLDKLANIDSMVAVFLKDIELFKDSLTNELSAKRIDYLIDSTPVKKIRIQQHTPKGSHFAIKDGDPAALKLEQDTIHFTGHIVFYPNYTLRKRFRDVSSYRVTFLLNDINQLAAYNGRLNEKIDVLRKNISNHWSYANRRFTLATDPSVSAAYAHGYVAGGDYLTIRASVDAQNYKSYFVPSFSVGAGLVISSHGFYKRDIMVSWEPHFFFSKDADGKLKTFRNDFVTLTYGQGAIRDNDPRKESHLSAIISLGYLVHRSGEFMDNRTIRLGMGRLSLFEGKTKIEPVLYFHDFLKNVTPGVRLIQSF